MVSTVDTFSPLWWQTSGLTVACTFVVLYAIRYLRREHRGRFARGLGWMLVLGMVVPPIVHALSGHWHISYGLPLQWCDFTAGLAGLALLTRGQVLYEISLFWGITGASSALLTPQFTQGTEWFFLAEFYISHGILLAAPFVLSICEDMRPRSWSWLTSLAWLNAAALAVGLFDYLIGANYMFLLSAPTADIPLYRIEWPFYLIGFEIALLAAFFVIYQISRVVKELRHSSGPASSAIAADARPEAQLWSERT